MACFRAAHEVTFNRVKACQQSVVPQRSEALNDSLLQSYQNCHSGCGVRALHPCDQERRIVTVICKQANWKDTVPGGMARGGAAPLPGVDTEDALLAIWE